jgi:hypothetical protein
MILLLLGEKAGMRESVKPNFSRRFFWTNFLDGSRVEIVITEALQTFG